MTMLDNDSGNQGTTVQVKTATFGLGCFWGPDAELGVFPGVIRTRVGYAGGGSPNPTYQSIGDHTEVVQVDYDPDMCSYADLLGFFWDAHNPERARYKRQYRSVILVDEEEQLAEATASYKKEEMKRGAALATNVEKLEQFYVGEDYHQKYSLRRDATIMAEFGREYADPQSFREATEAARVNGFISCHGTRQQLEEYLGESILSSSGRRHLRAMHGG